jgi:hypothetical protein
MGPKDGVIMTSRKKLWVAVLTLLGGLLLIFLPGAGAAPHRQSSGPSKGHKLYVKQGDKNIVLCPADLTFKTALSLGPSQSGLYGIPAPPGLTLAMEPLTLMLFDPDTAGASLRLSRLAHIDTAPAHTFDLATTKMGPVIFPKVYQVKYDASVPINLWCVDRQIPLRLTPMAGKPGWVRAVPEQRLDAGVYAVNFGGVEGPRVYTGTRSFYPFVLAGAPEPQTPPAPQ